MEEVQQQILGIIDHFLPDDAIRVRGTNYRIAVFQNGDTPDLGALGERIVTHFSERGIKPLPPGNNGQLQHLIFRMPDQGYSLKVNLAATLQRSGSTEIIADCKIY